MDQAVEAWSLRLNFEALISINLSGEILLPCTRQPHESATLGHALAPLSQALVDRTSSVGIGSSMSMAPSWRMSLPSLMAPLPIPPPG
jgi:hypothetical protein